MIHIVTGEYPPMDGGVGAYTAQLASTLADQGQTVHVWTGGNAPSIDEDGVVVHRIGGRFDPSGLAVLSRELDSFAGPRRILVQWTPHSFGMRGLNLAFPAWLWRRAARAKDRIEIVAHEAYIAFGEGSWRRDAAAAVQRVMVAALMQSAAKVWVTIPKWEERLRPYAFGKPIPFEWLPVPSNITSAPNVGAIVDLRKQFTGFRRLLVGHFGTYRGDIENLLAPALVKLQDSDAVFLLVGRGSQEARWRLVTTHPEMSRRVFATGELDSGGIAASLAACDALLQPYPDGISTRRGSAMAALSLGVPVVTNLGALSEELWSSTGAIAIARSSSAEDLAAATLDLMKDQKRRIQMSAAARSLYQDRFHIRHTVSALMRGAVPAGQGRASGASTSS